MLAATVAQWRRARPGSTLTVLSADPEQTSRVHQVPAIPRTDLRAITRALRRCDLFLSGGGSLIQDATSARSLLYYLGLLALARRLAGGVMIYAQGLGPLRRPWARRAAAWVLDRTDLITVRDGDARRLLADLGVRRPPVHLVADPAFALEPAPPESAEAALAEAGVPRGAPRIGLALRPWGTGDVVAPVVEAMQALGDAGAAFALLPMHPRVDLPVCEDAARRLGARAGVVRAALTPGEMMAVIGAMDLLIGARLHALIFAIATGVPPVGLSYDPKVAGLFAEAGLDTLLPLEGLTAPRLAATIASASRRREELRDRLRPAAAAFRVRAAEAVRLAAALLRS